MRKASATIVENTDFTLHMESRVEQSNKETKDAIAAAQRK
jgi:hypothetical protein